MPDNRFIEIGGRRLGRGHKALLTAEIGGNHGGDPQLAARMVRAAFEAGAGAVKFQAYRAAAFMSRRNPYFNELAAEELPFETLAELVSQARNLGLSAGLTAFDGESIALAMESGADFIKISSGDLTHHRLLEQAGRTGKPVIISTGAATEGEVEAALEILAPARRRVVVLQCASLYPAPPEKASLAVMRRWLSQGLAAGFSDHTLGTEAAQLALALGAMVVEKHFTIDQSLPGGDNSISARPEDFRHLARWIDLMPVMLGDDVKSLAGEMEVRSLIRRAVVAGRDLSAGLILTENDLALRRPPKAENALGPDWLSRVLGRAVTRPIEEGGLITLADLADG